MSKKQPSRSYDPPNDRKKPRGESVANNFAASRFAWTLDQVVIDGPFGWADISVVQLLTEVIPRLKELEGMTWAQIAGTGSHEISVDDIISKAKEELTALGYEGQDTVYSIRITGRRRVFGIKDKAIFRVLWWDPEHEICPSVKKHT